ncbi:hypothetical protein FA13DRAFT_1806337 [Coprinellus micaceus]|uniref:Aminoglycoside phosphotransferase domain-containing protein n=1 Tax=Coprinellus micaceus TaxID=71717 RepID=A0A4Y7RMZ9_COPMI|nr:hypothetical protein FA13DRAFT_1806337 [Coprinellus micaceus]
MAIQIGKGLGEFLGSVHAWGTEHRAECEIFQGHTEAKAIAGAYYYGQLVPFFSGSSWEPKALVSANDHFVQGDFWPGNMLLSLDDQGRLKNIMVVDWEMARIALPGMGKTSKAVLENFFSL